MERDTGEELICIRSILKWKQIEKLGSVFLKFKHNTICKCLHKQSLIPFWRMAPSENVRRQYSRTKCAFLVCLVRRIHTHSISLLNKHKESSPKLSTWQFLLYHSIHDFFYLLKKYLKTFCCLNDDVFMMKKLVLQSSWYFKMVLSMYGI